MICSFGSSGSARARYGDRVAVRNLPRTAAQRRFDAFFQMLEAGATNTGDAALADPVVDVIVDLDTFEQHLRADTSRPIPHARPVCGSSGAQ